MDLKQLRHFIAVASTLNFRRAAAELHIAQPALSVSIKRLEEDIGTPLFTRVRRTVALTEAGVAALEDARKALDSASRMRQQALAAVQGHVGTLRLCYTSTSTYTVLPRALERFKARCPGIRVVLQEGNADSIIESLQQRSFDVAIARYPMRAASGVVMQLVEKDRFCVALPLGHRLATLKQIRLQALADEAFLVPTAAHNPALHGLVIQACQVAGFMPRLAQEEAVQLSTVLALVEGGFGVALIPEAVARSVRRNVVFIRLSGTSASLETGLGLLHLDGPQSPRVALFRDAVLSLKPAR